MALTIRRALALLGLVVLACNNDGTGPTPAISVAVTPSTMSVSAGASGEADVTVSRSGEFTGTVELTLVGTPPGMTGTFFPVEVGSGSVVSTLTLSTSRAAVAGTYPLTIGASGNGVADATTVLFLTVTDAPNFSLAVVPAGLSVVQGGEGLATVSIARVGGFTDVVGLTLENAPAGVTGTFVPTPAPGGTSGLTVRVDPAVSPGDYHLTVRGTAAGLPDQTAALTLTVSPAGGFTLAADPATLSITPGGNASTTITIVRSSGFDDAVVLTSSTNAPTGVTITFTPASTIGTTSALGVTVGNGVALGTYTITARGTAAGLDVQTTVVTLKVVAPSGVSPGR